MSTKGIFSIKAYEILDSRGNPTLYCRVSTRDGISGWATVPSGASTGQYEAHELRDHDLQRYQGMGVQHAVYTIERQIYHALKDRNVLDQGEIDQTMIALDGTEHKSSLGANAMLAVSMAVSRCAAAYLHKPLYKYLRTVYWSSESEWTVPIPLMNIFNGGKHAYGSVDMQEFMIVPHGSVRFSEALRWGVGVYQSLKKILLSQNYSVGIGDEGGFMSKLTSHRAVLDLITQAIEHAGYKPGVHVSIALDPAASEFYKNGSYYLSVEHEHLSSDELIALYTAWKTKYPIVSIEDGLADDDWNGFQKMTKLLGNHMQIVGDDIYATNPQRIKKGIDMKVTNATIIKPNQIGTLTETVEAINVAQQHGLKMVISHRSGDTEDSFISDLAVACNAGQIKAGAPARTERVAKYNRLLLIEQELEKYAHFPSNVF
ncbi:MAG: Enolase [Microgenomates group bacterium GW2011_GWC1_41_8]|uniref:Enolase n=1 Tax=Candidatus Roizmanbacteria bacterium GW2011_GWC2_41_7 TaxID=1618487 RepID=A0A0G0XBB9_9BACT|nr:MAG: Enolase [Candidatus Levybacteria bacterium GW2011_GWA2_40_16]KKS21657.1 MAG: Enolase [Candidatus Roizmanbacteria bacterium GW2011_GWC2_41_7]KKS23644.1 MAG: Enolase [Microgenomates group bacterium GW2011_GWC1_41_8]